MSIWQRYSALLNQSFNQSSQSLHLAVYHRYLSLFILGYDIPWGEGTEDELCGEGTEPLWGEGDDPCGEGADGFTNFSCAVAPTGGVRWCLWKDKEKQNTWQHETDPLYLSIIYIIPVWWIEVCGNIKSKIY